MIKDRANAIVVVIVVSILHLLLAWGMAKIPLQKKEEMDIFLNNLQMVEVNLGSEAATESVPEIDPTPQPEPVTEMPEPTNQPEPTPDSLPPQQIITTEVKADKVDLIKAEAKPKPKEKPKPQEVRKEKPKKEPIKPKEVVEKKPAPPKNKVVRSEPYIAKRSVSASQKTGVSAHIADSSGKPNGIVSNTSSQGNSNVNSANTVSTALPTNASLGAGFGSAMRGSCSNMSNEADDEGKVGLKVTVSESGQATNVEITSSSGINRLDNQAKRMASSHRYSPAKANGRAVSGTVTFSIVFKCGNAA